MSLWLEEKYLRLLAPQLDLFKQKHPHVFNFRCPLCGDSERVLSKTRGYCYALKNTTLMYKCHNCSVSLPFVALLKRVSRHLYDEFMVEKVRDGVSPASRVPEAIQITFQRPPREDFFFPYVAPLNHLVDAQNPLYAVREYVLNRNVPATELHKMYATGAAHTWVKRLLLANAKSDDDKQWAEDKAKRVRDGHPYLVLPLRYPNGDWFGANVRAIGEKDYIIFRWHDTPLKMFGLENWTSETPTYVTEGPIDSLFLPNALAACGSDLMGAVRVLEDQELLKPAQKRIYIWDNEPRNKDIVRLIRTAVKLHEHVVIWPKDFRQKDINDMVNDGIDVRHVIQQRTFQGLMAELEFEAWKTH
jgi:hypothetical protein